MKKSDQSLPHNKAIYSGKLLKSALMKFPEGSYIISNVCPNGRPAIEGAIPPFGQRENYWKEIKKCRANGRLCYVFSNANDYLSYSLELDRIIMRKEFTDFMRDSLADFPPYSPSGED